MSENLIESIGRNLEFLSKGIDGLSKTMNVMCMLLAANVASNFKNQKDAIVFLRNVGLSNQEIALVLSTSVSNVAKTVSLHKKSAK